jgi:mannan endo-1,4-beta-mannosidase
MKFSLLTVASLLMGQTALAALSAKKFASTSNLQFTIDGKTGYFAGSNSYWIGFLTNNADVDLVFDHMKESGLKILRVWGFNDVNTVPGQGTVYYQLHANGKSTINTGADGLQRMDYVVHSAEKRGIKLIINFVNNWDDYGGMNAYVKAYGETDHNAFYSNENIQKAYRQYIKAVVSRYTNSPAVFAWELANEPRCKGCDTEVLYQWIKSTSQYIKSLDKRHMVCIGDGLSPSPSAYNISPLADTDESRGLRSRPPLRRQLPLHLRRRQQLHAQPCHPHHRLRNLPPIPRQLGNHP